MNKFVPERDLSPGVWQELLPQVLRIIDEIKKHGMRFPRFFVFQEVGFMLPVSLSVEQ
jgi:hypothetical protein